MFVYHENIFLQKFNDRFLHNFFQSLTSWRLSEAVSVFEKELAITENNDDFITNENSQKIDLLQSPYGSIWPLGTPICCEEVPYKYKFTILRTDISSSRTKTRDLDF